MSEPGLAYLVLQLFDPPTTVLRVVGLVSRKGWGIDTLQLQPSAVSGEAMLSIQARGDLSKLDHLRLVLDRFQNVKDIHAWPMERKTDALI